MFVLNEWMVGFWLLPVVLFIVVPLAMLVLWGFAQVVKRAGEKSRALYEGQGERGQEFASEHLEPTATV